MQALQLFLRLGQKVYPDDARAGTAKFLNDRCPELVASMTNYDASGKTITGFPTVHFAPCKDGFSVIGYGPAGIEALTKAMPSLVMGWGDRLKRPVQISHRQVSCSAESIPYQAQYRVGRLVLQKKAGHLKALENLETGKPHIERLILSSLQRQAEAMGIALPSNLAVEFLGGEGEFRARNGKHPVAHLGMHGVLFGINARLQGLWSAGYLMTRGYGLIDATYQNGAGINGMEESNAVSK
ncbi:hypothetical protein [Pseudomonas sp. MWU12-2323]|uniref:hypothetical protein n=1 Tax=Pseudomonas sp. MWU12-2323 TaxID=2651296 RepID=UPI00128DFD12|nr:hypothetical protein [Pseudomonas sp. MWU12-2323]MPQ69346.1 hypothetical protein [Pseudomonas sp. MWU12-2323]